MEIRAATLDDAPVLVDLVHQLGYGATEGEVAEHVRLVGGSPDVEAVVAEVEGRVVGWMELATRRALESGAWAEITGLVVDETMRGRGIGAALVAHARQWAQSRGLSRLRVRTNEKRTDTHRFYEAQGFHLTKMHRVYDMGA